MKKLGILVAGILSLVLVSRVCAMGSNYDSEIRSVLNEQAAAWNRGDLNSFMDGYLRSSDTSYVSGDCDIHGFDAIKERYQKRYGDDTSSMGKLTFSDLKVTSLGKTSALATGHFLVVRHDKPDANGVFTVIFVRSGGKWKVIHDHTTAFAAAS